MFRSNPKPVPVNDEQSPSITNLFSFQMIAGSEYIVTVVKDKEKKKKKGKEGKE